MGWAGCGVSIPLYICLLRRDDFVYATVNGDFVVKDPVKLVRLYLFLARVNECLFEFYIVYCPEAMDVCRSSEIVGVQVGVGVQGVARVVVLAPLHQHELCQFVCSRPQCYSEYIRLLFHYPRFQGHFRCSL